jgi:hypothetical protein
MAMSLPFNVVRNSASFSRTMPCSSSSATMMSGPSMLEGKSSMRATGRPSLSPTGASRLISPEESRRSMSIASCSSTPRRLAISPGVGSMPIAASFAFSLLRLKKSFRWACVVPSFTRRQLLMM